MEKASVLLSQILLGGNLKDKLSGARWSLSEIEWDSASVVLPETPGRGGGLRGQAQASHSFPKRSELKQESARGRLLHFFANHELLAIETMAFTLLKFPEAPVEFKQGVMKTLQDEQRHLGLYLARMRDFGVDFGADGQMPLNLYFWNALKTLQTPLDFVTRMSLTFEQANLDFALEYSRLFEQEIGDEKTAKLLKTVHDDEINHVAHGLKWFNVWRNRDESEFESYEKLLPFPLTARRGKGGKFFSAESRKKAGLSEEYIQAMRVAGGSRGRVPDYFFFNPQCEVEGKVRLTPALREKIRDLAPLMIWLAQEDDGVELPEKPDLKWQNAIFEFKGEMPEMIISSDGALPESAQKFAAIESLQPWGWGPSAWSRFLELENKIRRKPPFSASDVGERFFSKAWWKCELQARGVQVEGRALFHSDEFDHWRAGLSSEDMDSEFLLKSAVSTSGRGHLAFTRSMLEDEALGTKIRNRIRDEGAVVIEPMLPRRIDFSTQYRLMPNGEVREEEPRFFLTDSRHQYLGALLGDWGARTAFATETRFLHEHRQWLREQHRVVIEILRENRYEGPFGVDSLLYEADGELRAAPIIEVNVRHTMGTVALKIERALERKHGRRPALWVFLDRARVSARDLDERYPGKWLATTPESQAKSTWTAAIWDDSVLSAEGLHNTVGIKK